MTTRWASELDLDSMKAADGPEVLRIYSEGIATGNATLEREAPPWEKWDAAHLPSPRIVARKAASMLGWAALSPVSMRCAYAGVAEVSVYVAAAARGQGVGRALLEALIEASEREGLWTLQAGVFPENAPSLALVESCGFRRVGVRERLGKMTFGPLADTWRDVVLLERRSSRVGVG